MTFTPEAAMHEAIQLAKKAGESGNYPVAAVVADKNGIIASGGSTLVQSCDPSAHPEMVAIREACTKLNNRYIKDAYLFTTLEPCPMCTSAAIWAKMKGIYFATNQDDAYDIANELEGTKFTFRQIDVKCRDIVSAGHPILDVHENFHRPKMLEVYNDFIQNQKSQAS